MNIQPTIYDHTNIYYQLVNRLFDFQLVISKYKFQLNISLNCMCLCCLLQVHTKLFTFPCSMKSLNIESETCEPRLLSPLWVNRWRYGDGNSGIKRCRCVGNRNCYYTHCAVMFCKSPCVFFWIMSAFIILHFSSLGTSSHCPKMHVKIWSNQIVT